ncbi:MAG: hypothetical protein KGR98_02105 [Verrucomicrobia bacterium]|nr:hypothetical protein [Verrucomicrobiota bacterium]MDE3099348.1 hypothetical protein [Verrucomicrobiota bacterium]
MAQVSKQRQIRRSPLYHLMRTIVPCNHALDAKADLCGAVIIVGIAVSSVYLMRMLLALR